MVRPAVTAATPVIKARGRPFDVTVYPMTPSTSRVCKGFRHRGKRYGLRPRGVKPRGRPKAMPVRISLAKIHRRVPAAGRDGWVKNKVAQRLQAIAHKRIS